MVGRSSESMAPKGNGRHIGALSKDLSGREKIRVVDGVVGQSLTLPDLGVGGSR